MPRRVEARLPPTGSVRPGTVHPDDQIDQQGNPEYFVAGVERDGSRTLLASALTTLARPVGEEYRFTAVGGTTQARVWRGTPTRPGSAPQVALRLTPKPIDLIRRISVLTNHLHDTDQVHQAGQVGGVGRVQCPRTLAVEDLRVEGRRWTVQLCTWIGTGPVPPGRPEGSGRRLAHLHAAMSQSSMDFSDRPLSFSSPGFPTHGQPSQRPPAWQVARERGRTGSRRGPLSWTGGCRSSRSTVTCIGATSSRPRPGSPSSTSTR